MVRFRRFAEGLEWIGFVGLMLMLVFTLIDVIGSTLFNKPLRGSIEWVGFIQIIAIGGVVAIDLYEDRHIAIEFLTMNLSGLPLKVILKFVSIVGAVFFAALCWQSITYGLSLQKAGEVSSTAHLPMYPFAYFLAFIAVSAFLYYVAELLPARHLRSQERSTEYESG